MLAALRTKNPDGPHRPDFVSLIGEFWVEAGFLPEDALRRVVEIDWDEIEEEGGVALNATHRRFIERELLVRENAHNRTEVEVVKMLRDRYSAKAQNLERVSDTLATFDGLVDPNALQERLVWARTVSSALTAVIPKGRPASPGLSRFAIAMVCVFFDAGGNRNEALELSLRHYTRSAPLEPVGGKSIRGTPSSR